MALNNIVVMHVANWVSSTCTFMHVHSTYMNLCYYVYIVAAIIHVVQYAHMRGVCSDTQSETWLMCTLYVVAVMVQSTSITCIKCYNHFVLVLLWCGCTTSLATPCTPDGTLAPCNHLLLYIAIEFPWLHHPSLQCAYVAHTTTTRPLPPN